MYIQRYFKINCIFMVIFTYISCMQIQVRNQKVLITGCTILNTRNHFADIYEKSIEDVLIGEVKVNDIEDYCAWCRQRIVDTLSGEYENNFTFLQRAYWLQTGESIALL